MKVCNDKKLILFSVHTVRRWSENINCNNTALFLCVPNHFPPYFWSILAAQLVNNLDKIMGLGYVWQDYGRFIIKGQT